MRGSFRNTASFNRREIRKKIRSVRHRGLSNSAFLLRFVGRAFIVAAMYVAWYLLNFKFESEFTENGIYIGLNYKVTIFYFVVLVQLSACTNDMFMYLDVDRKLFDRFPDKDRASLYKTLSKSRANIIEIIFGTIYGPIVLYGILVGFYGVGAEEGTCNIDDVYVPQQLRDGVAITFQSFKNLLEGSGLPVIAVTNTSAMNVLDDSLIPAMSTARQHCLVPHAYLLLQSGYALVCLYLYEIAFLETSLSYELQLHHFVAMGYFILGLASNFSTVSIHLMSLQGLFGYFEQPVFVAAIMYRLLGDEHNVAKINAIRFANVFWIISKVGLYIWFMYICIKGKDSMSTATFLIFVILMQVQCVTLVMTSNTLYLLEGKLRRKQKSKLENSSRKIDLQEQENQTTIA